MVCGWFLVSHATFYPDSTIERLQDDRATAPSLRELEFTNVLRTACLRQRMTAESAQRVIARIGSLPIDVDRAIVPARKILALALALRLGLSTYDAAYLELALRLQLPLATGDGLLRDAALASGVDIAAGEG